ncbi:MAG: carbohydrate binding domain-containing protein [Fibrobacter sp.]|nr:carbohydrate binding domain-containing protein [Fibrobacter sp.]
MKSRTAILVTSLLVSLLSAQETQNLVKNGDFSDSLNYVWNFNANGAVATGKIESAGRYFIEVTTPGASDNAPQLQQGNITLEKNEAYVLKFTAYSSEPATIRAQLKSNETIYTDTAAGTFTLTESPKVYSVPFFVSQNTNSNVELQFNCGINRQKTRIAFNKVSLTKDTTTQIIFSKPEAGESWKTGLEKKIKWITIGNLNSVTIKYTNGKAWKTITELVANDNEYTWLIPQEAAGESCRILVSSINGKISDTSSVFSITASSKPETPDSGNIVKNGEFSDTTDWKFEVFDGVANGKFVNGEYAIEIEELTNSSRENSYQVKLSQSSIKLESGVMYYFSFDAYGSEEKVIYANVGESGGAYKTVFGGDTIPVNLTTEKKTYSYAFIANEVSDGPDYRVEFNCATNIGKVVIDNVKLVKSSNAEYFIMKPFANTVHKVGSVMSVEWYPSDVQTIALEYSTDNGKKWKSIADSIGNLYAYQWTVPEESSVECLLRVLDAATDSVLGKSAVFQINSFGIPVKKGEQIINGKFALEMTGWNGLTLSNGAEASAYVKDKSLKVSIDEAGDSLSDITLSQGNLTLQKGTEYFFSFDGYSAGIRKMQVSVKSMENDSVVLFDSIVSLPQVSDFFEWTFVPEFDVFGKVEFKFGGSSALVSLDNISVNTDHVSVRKIARKSSINDLMTMKIMHTGSNITFMLNEKVDGMLNIYNLSGKLVRSLNVSSSSIVWDRKDVYGKMTARGSYIAALRADKKKMVHSFLVK